MLTDARKSTSLLTQEVDNKFADILFMNIYAYVMSNKRCDAGSFR